MKTSISFPCLWNFSVRYISDQFCSLLLVFLLALFMKCNHLPSRKINNMPETDIFSFTLMANSFTDFVFVLRFTVKFICRGFLSPLVSKYIYINRNRNHINSISVKKDNVNGAVHLNHCQNFRLQLSFKKLHHKRLTLSKCASVDEQYLELSSRTFLVQARRKGKWNIEL